MVKKFGMLCVDCRHNTEGENCHRCRNRYYRNRNVPTNDTRTCTACNCNALGSYGKWCQPRGQCNCKPRFWGRTCNKCKLGYYRVNGSCKKLPNICETAVCANLTWNADDPYTRCFHTSSGWCSCGNDMFVNCSKLSLPGRVNSQGADPSSDGGNSAPYIHRSQYFIYMGTLLYMFIHL
uniref:Laminin EGF-like domain-containing protein n=1 Tax=Ciona savignyi TaxID=51511 RepID=H2Z1E6_CIOSA